MCMCIYMYVYVYGGVWAWGLRGVGTWGLGVFSATMDKNARKVLEETFTGRNAFVRELHFDLEAEAPTDVVEPEARRQWVPNDFNKRVVGKNNIADVIGRLIPSITLKGFDHVNPDGYMVSCELLPKSKERRVVVSCSTSKATQFCATRFAKWLHVILNGR